MGEEGGAEGEEGILGYDREQVLGGMPAYPEGGCIDDEEDKETGEVLCRPVTGDDISRHPHQSRENTHGNREPDHHDECCSEPDLIPGAVPQEPDDRLSHPCHLLPVTGEGGCSVPSHAASPPARIPLPSWDS